MQYRFVPNVQQGKASAVREILKLTQGKSMISLAGGLPNEALFPMEAVRSAADRALSGDPQALQYGITEGYVPLREKLCERMAERKNIHVGLENIMLTTGSQQAIDLLARVYLEPNDVVLVENPTYLACLHVLRFRDVHIVPVQSDEHGMIPEDLENKIKQYAPKMVYVVPTFSNPTGNVWSVERRLALLNACRAHEILILEDDPYGELRFGDQDGQAQDAANPQDPFPTIFSLDQHPDDSVVVYTSTFSKTVAPALRTGWAIADKRVIQMMTRMKQSVDIHSSMLDQQILYELLNATDFSLDQHISEIRTEYESRMLLMKSLLEGDDWRETSWTTPKGGMFFWVELPDGLDADALLRVSVMKGVAFVPGSDFYAAEAKRNRMRLNFTHSSREQITKGMHILAESIGEFVARS
ncbi:aminotransferase [Paenibacillus selenitireducens]|uniref:Aminotransferase n=1 Tax=Paenibacillus selenitireducens TaxID=1324314 RepID=A0A1T2X9U3_9BACL|nr:PLP-dependent aminotransferase family protein [Paenibacillus selenitireducens]OPA76674.1 aminotransferase [Paenibacillus selenitireducens]